MASVTTTSSRSSDSALCAACAAAADERAPLGVDIGTTTTSVAQWDAVDGAPRVLYTSAGRPWCASVPVYDENTGEVQGLHDLLPHARTSATRMHGVKRLVGAPFSDPCTRRDVQSCGALGATGGTGAVDAEGAQDVVHLCVSRDGTAYTPLRVTQHIVQAALQDVLERCTCGARLPHSAVVTVPADFTPLQRTVTALAAENAGLRVLQLVNEPTAALLHAAAGGAVPPPSTDHVAVVFDWGGGTFDATVLTPDAAGTAYDVLASAGDTHLGGVDVDTALATARGIPVHAAAAAKQTAVMQGTAFVGDVAVTADAVRDAAALSVRRAVHLTTQAVSRSGHAASDVTHVVLVGGSSQLPGVRAAVQAAFPAASVAQWHGDETQLCVVQGAAWLAAQLQRDAAVRRDGVPGGAQHGALGDAAGSAARVFDALTHTISVRVADKYTRPMIRRDAPLPASGSAVFTTQHDGQVVFDVGVFAGEATLARHCACLGEFRIHGVPPAPAGAQRVRVVVRADASGTVCVTATHAGHTTEKVMQLLTGDAARDAAAGGTEFAHTDAVAQAHMKLWAELWNRTVLAKRAARASKASPFASAADVARSVLDVQVVCDEQYAWMRAASARQLEDGGCAVHVDDLDEMRRRIEAVQAAVSAHEAAMHTASLVQDAFLRSAGDNILDAEDGARWLREHRAAAQ